MNNLRKFAGYLQQNSIRENSLKILFCQFAILLVSTITGVIIARYLGPSKKGVVDLFKLLTGFITDFGTFGFGVGLLFYRLNKKAGLVESHGNVIFFSLINGLFSFLLGFSGLSLWGSLFEGLPKWAILLGFGISFSLYYFSLWSYLAISINKVIYTYLLGLLSNILFFVLIIVATLTKKLNIEITILLSVLNSLISTVLAFLLLCRQEKRITGNFELFKGSIQYGFINYLGIIANTINFRIDQVLVNYFLGSSAIGIYTVSVRWAELLLYLDVAVSTAALYKVGTSPETESSLLTQKILRIQLLISGVGGLGLVIIANPLVKILYGNDFIQAVQPLLILIPGLVMWSISKPISHFLIYKLGKVWIPTIIAIISAVINFGINLWFIPRLGIKGASLASTISYTVTAILTIAIFLSIKTKPIVTKEVVQ